MGLFHTGNLVCVTGQGGIDGSADGSDLYEHGICWYFGRVAGDESSHQIVDYVFASTF